MTKKMWLGHRTEDVVLGGAKVGSVSAEAEKARGVDVQDIGKSSYWLLGIGLICLSLAVPGISAQDVHSSLIRAPYSLSFGESTVGKATDPQTVTLLNTGAAGVQLNRIAITGDFIQTNDCPVSPAPLVLNQSCNIEVIFKSSSVVPVLGTASVFYDGSAVPLTVSLSGAGTLRVPIVTMYPFDLNFSEQLTGPQTLTIVNSGKRSLRFFSINVKGDFMILPSSTCESLGGLLAPDESCSVVVTFRPLDVGKHNGQITFTDDAKDSPQHVALNGISKQ